jgi:hypothetical protein
LPRRGLRLLRLRRGRLTAHDVGFPSWMMTMVSLGVRS